LPDYLIKPHNPGVKCLIANGEYLPDLPAKARLTNVGQAVRQTDGRRGEWKIVWLILISGILIPRGVSLMRTGFNQRVMKKRLLIAESYLIAPRYRTISPEHMNT